MIAGPLTTSGWGQFYQPVATGLSQQPLAADQVQSTATTVRGFHLETMVLNLGSSATSLPNSGGVLPHDISLGWDAHMSGEATLSWRMPGERTNFSLVYSPSFVGWRRYSSWNSINHSLVLSLDQKLSGTWKFALNGSAGSDGSQQLAVASTGDASAELIRVYTASLRAALTRSFSRRSSLQIGLSGGRYQARSVPSVFTSVPGSIFISHTTSGQADVKFTYRVSPLTELGVDGSASRYISPVQDVTLGRGGVSLKRAVTPSWSVQINGGATALGPSRMALVSPVSNHQRYGWVAGGGLDYKGPAHSLSFSGDRMAGDPYGLGAQSNVTATASWTWRRRERNWDLLSVCRFQRTDVPGLQRFDAWQIESGYARLLTSQLALVTSYAYISNSSRFTGAVYGLSQQGARISFMWGPQPLTFR